MSVCQRLVTDWKNEIKDQLSDSMSSTTTVYINERHVCTRIDKFQNGLTRFTKLPAKSDVAGEKPWPIFRTVWHFGHTFNTVEYHTLWFCKPHYGTPKIAKHSPGVPVWTRHHIRHSGYIILNYAIILFPLYLVLIYIYVHGFENNCFQWIFNPKSNEIYMYMYYERNQQYCN